jgi:hypothetical protein
MSCCALSLANESTSISLLTEVCVTFTVEPRGVRFLLYSPETDIQKLFQLSTHLVSCRAATHNTFHLPRTVRAQQTFLQYQYFEVNNSSREEERL